MTIDQMRDEILEAYPGPRWREKVAKMDDDQVMALYFKFHANPPKKKAEKKYEIKTGSIDEKAAAVQLSIYDMLLGRGV